MDHRTLDRLVAIFTIIGGIAAVIALYPIFFDHKEVNTPPDGINMVSGLASGDHGQLHDIASHIADCNGRYICDNHACTDGVFEQFAKGSHKQCHVLYTCGADVAHIQHLDVEEGSPIILRCKPEDHSLPWRLIVGLSMGALVFLLIGVFVGRRFSRQR